jgi:hypothetical protein
MDLKTAKERVEAILGSPDAPGYPGLSPKIAMIKALREAYSEGYQAASSENVSDDADTLARHKSALLRANAQAEAWRELVSMLLNRLDDR